MVPSKYILPPYIVENTIPLLNSSSLIPKKVRLHKASRVQWGIDWALKSFFCPYENVENAAFFQAAFSFFSTFP